MPLLLEVVGEREVEEGPPRGHELHRRGQPALHHRDVARGQLAVQLGHVPRISTPGGAGTAAGSIRGPQTSPLTRRERQVADLVAAGRTNRQIARALTISEKTVEVHVHNVIAKLGAQSRTEVAARGWSPSRARPYMVLPIPRR